MVWIVVNTFVALIHFFLEYYTTIVKLRVKQIWDGLGCCHSPVISLQMKKIACQYDMLNLCIYI